MGQPPASGPGSPQQPLSVVPGSGWLQLAMQAITTVGVPTVFAAVLLWFVLTSLGDTLANISKQEDARVQLLTQMQQGLLVGLDTQTKRFEEAIKQNLDANRVATDRLIAALEKQGPNPRP